MIVELLLDLIESVLTWLAGLFPTMVIDPGSSFGFFAHLGDMNYYLPIKEVFAFTVGAFLVFPLLAGVSLATWLIALIRGGSARG